MHLESPVRLRPPKRRQAHYPASSGVGGEPSQEACNPWWSLLAWTIMAAIAALIFTLKAMGISIRS